MKTKILIYFFTVLVLSSAVLAGISDEGFQKISDTAGDFTGTLDDYDFFGYSVANIGDLDNDGVDDLAVGARLDDDGGSNRGAVWILFMNTDGTVSSQQKISDTQGDFTGVLDNSDYFGWSVASIGDLDGDGIEDIVVGAQYDDDGGTNRGAVWILFLGTDGKVDSYQKISDTQGDFTGVLDRDDFFGSSVANIGDLDNDGIEDIAVGAYDDDGGSNRGAVWILFLGTDGKVDSYQKISDTQGDFTGTLDNYDNFGSSVANIGDLDGDGIEDIAVGAQYDADGGDGRGAVWILFLGTDGKVDSYQKISDTQGDFTGALDNSDYFGKSVASIGDLDNDGIEDIAVGAIGDDDGGTWRGAVWILFLGTDGKVDSYQKISDTQGNFTGTLDNYDQFGTSVAGIGDLDNDGIEDIAVGAQYDADGGDGRGAVYILTLNTDGTVNQGGISLDGMRLPDNSWGVKSFFGNGAADIECGNYNGLVNGFAFNGFISECNLGHTNGWLEICKNCAESQPTKWGWIFKNLVLTTGIDNDLSNSMIEIATKIGIDGTAWSMTNGLADRLYGNAFNLGNGLVDVNIISTSGGDKFYKCDDNGANCVEITNDQGVSQLGALTWQIPASGAFGGTHESRDTILKFSIIHGGITVPTCGDGVIEGDEQCEDNLCHPASNSQKCYNCQYIDVSIEAEFCNGMDENCNGQIDEGVKITSYLDADGDGFGNALNPNPTEACTPPAGHVIDTTDCNDNDLDIYPDAEEICNNGVDDDCDNLIDQSDPECVLLCTDNDNDGFNIEGGQCGPIDCNDDDLNINPGAAEVCNGVDDDCDDQVDFASIVGDLDNTCGTDSCEGTDTYFDYFCNEGVGCATDLLTQDTDTDGFNGLCTDCNDNDNGIYPGAQELCPDDGIDNNCDGASTVNCDALCDFDNDGFWDSGIWYCLGGDDCDDTSAAINPDAEEICNNVDDNCDDNSGYWISPGQVTSSFDDDPATGVDNRDADDDAVNDCTFDQCFNTPGGVVVNADGCTAKQFKDDAANKYADMEIVLLQSGSEIGSGEYWDVLNQYLLPAKLGIVNENYLYMYDVGVLINGTLVDVKKGSITYDHQNNVVVKLEEFKGKKIGGIVIWNLPGIRDALDEIQLNLVEDSRLIAQVILDELDCNSLSGSAKIECDLGWDFYAEAPTKLNRAEQIDYYKKAWEQGVKVLVMFGIVGPIACETCN